MFMPLHDGAPMLFLRRPVVNYSLIGLNIVVFLTMNAGVFGDIERLDLALGTIPAVLFDHSTLAKGLAIVPEPFTLLTSQFVHGGLAHIVGNMLFLWVFGDNVEDAMGSLRYLVFYLTCGAAGALAFSIADPTSQAPLIGASGAISGVVVAYMILYPRIRVLGLVLNIIPLRVPAVWCLGGWISLQIISALSSEHSEVGFWTHVGGVACGAVLTPFFHRAAVPLFSAREA
jgi:membrane associated rhomboid family serine protease